MNPLSGSLFVVGALGLALGLAGGFGVLAVQVTCWSSCPVANTIPGPATCSGSNTICPSFAFVEKGYLLRAWVNGTEARGVSIDNNSYAYDTTYIGLGPANSKGCVPTGGTCSLSFNVSSVTQGGGAFTASVSKSLGGPFGLSGSYLVNAQILYTVGQVAGYLSSRTSLYTAPIAITIPGNASNGGCGSSCFTLSPGFSFRVSGLSGTFNDTSSVVNGAVSNVTWKFGDGATASGLSVAHTYAKPGSYAVTESVTASSSAVVNAGNQLLWGSTTLTVNATAVPNLTGQVGQTNPPSGPSGPTFHTSLVTGALIGASLVLMVVAWVSPKHPGVIAAAIAGGALAGGIFL